MTTDFADVLLYIITPLSLVILTVIYLYDRKKQKKRLEQFIQTVTNEWEIGDEILIDRLYELPIKGTLSHKNKEGFLIRKNIYEYFEAKFKTCVSDAIYFENKRLKDKEEGEKLMERQKYMENYIKENYD